MIKAKKLIHKYTRYDADGNVTEQKMALTGVDLNIKPGDFVAILGHNGSGKSTLAKHLNVLLYPDGGELVVDGKDVYEEKNLWDIRQSAGMVFQNPDNQIVAAVI